MSLFINHGLTTELSCGPQGRLLERLVPERESAREETVYSFKSVRAQINSAVPEARSAEGTK
jgi:hypothetical protein